MSQLCPFVNFSTAGVDYAEVNAEIRFAPFEQLSCANISITDNHIVGEERTKSFHVELHSNLSKVVIVEVHASAQINIEENDGMTKV